MYKIGELARLSQVAVRTLRYYDQFGLLVPAHVDRATGYRGYTAPQFERINRILACKDLGLSLAEIRALLDAPASASEIHALVERKQAELEHRIAADRRRLARATARLAMMTSDREPLPDIAIRTTAACWVASIRQILPTHDACDALFDELDDRIRSRRAPAQRGAIWHACAPGVIDCEAFEMLSGPDAVAATGRVVVRQLPAQRVAALIYRGDVDYLPAYRAMRTWITTSGMQVVGAKRELFLRGEQPVTEIQFPIAAPRAVPARRPTLRRFA